MSKAKAFSPLEHAIVGYMIACCCILPVRAGTQGAYMNSLGFGKAVDTIVYKGQTFSASSGPRQNPSASTSAPLGMYCQSQGFPNYIWSIKAYVTDGASADHPELDAKVNVTPAPCAEYTIESTSTFTETNPNQITGLITVKTMATEGAAVWLRGFEYLGDALPENLTLAELLADSDLKWDMVLTGPFDLTSDTTDNCTALKIPVTIKTNSKNLYLIADGLAKSTPLQLTCPSSTVTYACNEAVDQNYSKANVQVSGGCGNVNVVYSPLAESLPAALTTVTATATDDAGGTTTCTFTVDNSSKKFEVVKPADVKFSCSEVVKYPDVTVIGGCGNLTVTYDPPAASLPNAVKTVIVTVTDELNRKLTTSFVADNSAKAVPLGITCVGNVVFGCTETPVYPTPQVTGACSGYTLSYSIPATSLPIGVQTSVTVTVTDGAGRTASFPFKATRKALQFDGFESPIDGTGGSCASPFRSISLGKYRTLPIKFETECNGYATVSGPKPTLQILKCDATVVLNATFESGRDDWHYNWDTKNLTANTVYQIKVTLQDGSQKSVFIKLVK